MSVTVADLLYVLGVNNVWVIWRAHYRTPGHSEKIYFFRAIYYLQSAVMEMGLFVATLVTSLITLERLLAVFFPLRLVGALERLMAVFFPLVLVGTVERLVAVFFPLELAGTLERPVAVFFPLELAGTLERPVAVFFPLGIVGTLERLVAVFFS